MNLKILRLTVTDRSEKAFGSDLALISWVLGEIIDKRYTQENRSFPSFASPITHAFERRALARAAGARLGDCLLEVDSRQCWIVGGREDGMELIEVARNAEMAS